MEATGGSNSSGVFATSKNEHNTVHKDRNQDGQKLCLCGIKHQFDECFYLNFNNTTRPSTFKYKKEIFNKINGKLKASYMSKVRTYVSKKLGYDSEKTPSMALAEQNSAQLVSEEPQLRALGSFINHYVPCIKSNFSVENTSSYHLNSHWVLDSGSDIHICNQSMSHLFTANQNSINNHRVVAGASEYKIEAWGTCRVSVSTPNGQQFILLKSTAYIPNFMTSFVALSKLTSKEIYWSSRKPTQLENSDGSVFCWLFKSGDHIVFESGVVVGNSNNNRQAWALNSGSRKIHHNSSLKRHKTFSRSKLHRILGHPSPEVINHVADAVREGNISIFV